MATYGWLETFWQDVRLAARGLRKSPGFLAVVVLSLALGIGANSTIFSMLNTLLYRPLPYGRPQQLTVIWQTEKEHPEDWQAPPIAELADWKKQTTVFQDIALTSFTEEVIMSRSGEGIVGNVKHFGLGREDPPFMYTSYLQQQAVFPGGTAIPHLRHYVVIRRAAGNAGNELAGEVKKAIAKIDPDLPVTSAMTMEAVIADSLGDYRIYLQLLGAFAAVAALLAAVGIYGVMSYFVSQRTREIGIRVALGASRGDVLRIVAKLGLKLALLGVAVGVALRSA